MRSNHICRVCGAGLSRIFVDLGMSPLANSYLTAGQLNGAEVYYPLRVFVCDACLLVQVPEHESSEKIFSEYLYFSSFSTSWLQHARAYTEEMTRRFALGAHSRVVEVASNDGYLLQYFREKGIAVLGIEPAANVARAAEERGIPTRTVFFDEQTARALADEGWRADLIVNNNVLAHVPGLHGFLAGLQVLLKPGGVITVEVPHVMELIRCSQFDTIYHEHFSYFSLHVMERAFAAHGLTVFDVERIPTHGGSLRIFATHAGEGRHTVCPGVGEVRRLEECAGLTRPEGYDGFAERVAQVKCDLLEFLLTARRQGKTVAGYGAPAKGNTLLNYAGIGPELLPYTVDRSPHKQGRFLPGVHIPIHAPERIFDLRPDYVLILPWNLRQEIMGQMAGIGEWGGRFATAVPSLELY